MEILDLIKAVVVPFHVQVLGVGIVLNLVLGTLAAIRNGVFQIGKFKDIWTRIAAYSAVYLVVSAFVKVATDEADLLLIAWLQPAIWIGLVMCLYQDIRDNVRDLVGIELPDISGWINAVANRIFGKKPI